MGKNLDYAAGSTFFFHVPAMARKMMWNWLQILDFIRSSI